MKPRDGDEPGSSSFRAIPATRPPASARAEDRSREDREEGQRRDQEALEGAPVGTDHEQVDDDRQQRDPARADARTKGGRAEAKE